MSKLAATVIKCQPQNLQLTFQIPVNNAIKVQISNTFQTLLEKTLDHRFREGYFHIIQKSGQIVIKEWKNKVKGTFLT
jgi:hypothetical protein